MKTKTLKNQASNYSSKFENKPLKKWFVLATVLLLFGFNKVSAQNEFDVNVYLYNTSCNWTITAYDASSNVLWFDTPSSWGLNSYLCNNQGLGTAALDHIIISGGTGCGLTTYTFGSSGVFNYTQYTGVCCGNSMSCQGGTGTAGPSPCGPTTGKNLLIYID